MRRCRKCGETKPLSEFDVRADTGKPRATCKACRRGSQNARNARLRPPREPRPPRLASSTELLECTRCGERKTAAEFPPVRRDEERLQTWCRACFAVVNAENYVGYYARDRDRIHERQRGRREDIRGRLIANLSEHPCVDCGETDIVVLEFDHVGEKVADVSTYANGSRAWTTIAAEIAKCEVRCANCHRRKTLERQGLSTRAWEPFVGAREPHDTLQLSLDAALGMRACRTCHRLKPLLDFPFRSIQKQTRKWVCRECQRVLSRRWYAANRSRHLASARRAQRSARNRARSYVRAYLQEHGCVDCGETDLRVLEFDHLRDKVADVSAFVRSGRAIPAIAAEISKCEVRCANCHRRITCSRVGAYRARATRDAAAAPSDPGAIRTRDQQLRRLLL